jgi:NADH-quinone oxidoreductase subunit N
VTDFTFPEISYTAIGPLIALFAAACAGVLAEAMVPRRWRHPVQLVLALGGVAVAFLLVVRLAGASQVTAGGSITVDGPALFLQGALLAFGFVALLLIGERSVEPGGAFVSQAAITVGSDADRRQLGAPGATEVFPLTMFSLGGMALFVSASDLLTMFIALEVLSLPLYLMCALARRRRLLSQEAAVKYFLLGAYASGFFLFGLALLYGFAGTVDFAGIHAAVATSQMDQGLLVAGLGLVVTGLLFKAAAAPFHVWTPDVYQGAPTPVVAFMAAGTKVAAFGAMLRVLYVAFERASWDWQLVIGAVAVLTMLVGAILAVTQTDMKRLLAYSSIANAGYALVAFAAPVQIGAAAIMFYLVAYGFAVIGAFAIVSLVRDSDGGEAHHLSRWAGLGQRWPLLAGVFTVVMLALAGIPLTAGFTAKFAVFGAALTAGQPWLVIAGVVSSLIIAFPYLRVVVMMWLSEPGEGTATLVAPGMFTSAAVALGAVAIVALGVVPGPLLDLASNASLFLR